MLAADQMTRKVYVAEPAEDLRAVQTRMREHGIRHMPVVERGRPIGIVSDRDIIRHTTGALGDDLPAWIQVRDVMSARVATAPVTATVAEIAAFMLDARVDAVPITRDDGTLAGIVTSADILRMVARPEPSLIGAERTADLLDRFAWDFPNTLA